MSEATLLAILSLGELAALTTGLAVFLFLRNKKLRDANQQLTENTPPGTDLQGLLQTQIQQSRDKLNDLPEDQAELLKTRLAFLESEMAALDDEQNSDAYWQNLCERMASLGPTASHAPVDEAPPDEDQPETDSNSNQPVLTELDDIDINEENDSIPILEDQVAGDDGVNRDGSLTIESSNDDMERLRKIISRQHENMDELKKSLAQKDMDSQKSEKLSKTLEEVEVAQAQLNMCVETLEQENARLNELLKEQENSANGQELSETRQQLEEANERITNLERENSLQAERIDELEHEIAELEQQLKERSEELERLNNMEADLSQTDTPSSNDPDSLMKEIEDLTDLITTKSEELSKLQSRQSDDPNGLDFEPPDQDDGMDAEPLAGKAAN